MRDKEIVVPEGMWDAAQRAASSIPMNGNSGSVAKITVALEASLRWLADNPIVPTEDVAVEMGKKFPNQPSAADFVMCISVEWQRRMFLAPEPEVPEEVANMMQPEDGNNGGPMYVLASDLNRAVLEAFRRGKQSTTHPLSVQPGPAEPSRSR